MAKISVVIPVAASEKSVLDLAQDLSHLPAESEVVFVVAEEDQFVDDKNKIQQILKQQTLQWILSDRGRAAALTMGAEVAKGNHVWFIHADSRVCDKTINAMLTSVDTDPEAIWYCWLRYMADGPAAVIFNQWGANIRSWFFKLPFGDQAICLSKNTLYQLGGFRNDVEYGEDHVLMWQAKHLRIAIRCCGGTVWSSARKYQEHGWLSVTCAHQILWFKQMWPECKKYLRNFYQRLKNTS